MLSARPQLPQGMDRNAGECGKIVVRVSPQPGVRQPVRCVCARDPDVSRRGLRAEDERRVELPEVFEHGPENVRAEFPRVGAHVQRVGCHGPTVRVEQFRGHGPGKESGGPFDRAVVGTEFLIVDDQGGIRRRQLDRIASFFIEAGGGLARRQRDDVRTIIRARNKLEGHGFTARSGHCRWRPNLSPTHRHGRGTGSIREWKARLCTWSGHPGVRAGRRPATWATPWRRSRCRGRR